LTAGEPSLGVPLWLVIFALLATQLLLPIDFDPFCVNLILILCKTVDSFTEVTKAKPITVNHLKLNSLQLEINFSSFLFDDTASYVHCFIVCFTSFFIANSVLLPSFFCVNLILILCKTIDSFIEVTKAKPITVNHLKLKFKET